MARVEAAGRMIGKPFDIAVARCRVNAAAREVRPIHVETLARSIAAIGLIQPISVRRVGEDFEVIAGIHRLMAFRQLGRSHIPALVRDADDLHAELALIDENLIRNELSPAERARAIARRKAIWDALHPDTRAHVAGGKARHRPASDNLSFAASTAHATGKNRRTVERDAHRGAALGEETLKAVTGTSLDSGDELDALARLAGIAPAAAAAIVARAAAGQDVSVKTAVKHAARAEKEAALGAHQRALPDRKYGVILADPEWEFDVWGQETGQQRAAANHYPTSPIEAICARPVANIAADDCVLFLWATAPKLPDALRVLAAWGFHYVTHAVWIKNRMGTGYWLRNKHELLLIGRRGAPPKPADGTQWVSAIDADVRGHSVKPDWQYDLIEQYFPHLPKIELNARRARAGWDAWGYEAPATGEIDDDAAADSAGADRDADAAGDDHDGCGRVAGDGDRGSAKAQTALSATSASDGDGLIIPDFLRRA